MEGIEQIQVDLDVSLRDIYTTIVETFEPGNKLHRQALYPSADMANTAISVADNTLNFFI